MRCPTDERIFTPSFQQHPLQDTSGALEHNDTVYLLLDRPSRVFLHTEQQSRIFGNVWLLNGSLIFRGLCHVSISHHFLSNVFPDSSGVLEGERLVRSSNTRYYLRHIEHSVVNPGSESRSRLNRRYLLPIMTPPPSNPSSVGDWRIGQLSVAQHRTPLTHTFTVYGDLLGPQAVWYVPCV